MRIKVSLIIVLFAGLVSTVQALTVAEEAKLVPGAGAIVDHFGDAVAISGNTIVVGAFGDFEAGFFTGAAYVYQRSRLGWMEQAKLIASDAADFDFFGDAVDVSGNTVVVGAYADDDACPSDPDFCDSGSAYIFQKTASGWQEVAKLTASDAAGGSRFGSDVAISGGTVAVRGAGAIYLFQRTPTGWHEVATLTASDGSNLKTVAMDRDIVIAGGGFSNSFSAVYIYQNTATGWREVAKLTASDGEGSFGRSIDIDSNTILVGAAGAAYIFQRSGLNWQEQAKLTTNDGIVFAFGSSVGISGGTVIIGKPNDDSLGINSGAAYLFQRTGGDWVLVSKLLASDGEGFDMFGHAVDMSGDTVIIGAYGHKGLEGAAYIFKLN